MARRPLLHGAMIADGGYVAGRGAAAMASPAASAAAPARTDLVSKIQELKALNDEGVLTADEFQAAKRKLLAG